MTVRHSSWPPSSSSQHSMAGRSAQSGGTFSNLMQTHLNIAQRWSSCPCISGSERTTRVERAISAICVARHSQPLTFNLSWCWVREQTRIFDRRFARFTGLGHWYVFDARESEGGKEQNEHQKSEQREDDVKQRRVICESWTLWDTDFSCIADF